MNKKEQLESDQEGDELEGEEIDGADWDKIRKLSVSPAEKPVEKPAPESKKEKPTPRLRLILGRQAEKEAKNPGIEEIEGGHMQFFEEPTEDLEEEVEKEQKEPSFQERFLGQDAELTVERKGGRKEGGWRILTPPKGGEVVVCDLEHTIEKTYRVDKLIELQPFKVKESVPVLRGPEEKRLDAEGWKITKHIKGGLFEVVKTDANGEFRARKEVSKASLIKAKIAEVADLEAKKDKLIDEMAQLGISPSNLEGINTDIKKIEEDLKTNGGSIEYWQAKLDTINRLEEKAKLKVKTSEPKEEFDYSSENWIGETPSPDDYGDSSEKIA